MVLNNLKTNKIMKNLILSLIGTYLMVAFCLWNLNVGNWEVMHRLYTVILGVLIGCWFEVIKNDIN